MAEDKVTIGDPGEAGIVQAEQLTAVRICRAVYGGTENLRDQKDYLPQWEREDDGAYARRLETAVLHNAFKKTVRGMEGLVFRKNPVFTDVDSDVLTYLENVDLAGQHVDLFLAQGFRGKMIDGHGVILVDWHGPEGARSMKDEQVALARPYWTLIRKEQVKRAPIRTEGGAVVLESFAYEDREVRRVGDFEQRLVWKVRQFDVCDAGGRPIEEDEPLPQEKARRVLFRSWVREREDGDWEQEEEKILGDRMTKIPVVFDYAERIGFGTSDPPFLDLAFENVRHWQLRSDKDVNLHMTLIPILNTFGVEAEKLQTVVIGSSMGLAFTGKKNEEGSEYTEASGYGQAHARDELLDIEKRMAGMGLAALERQVRVAETAEAHRQNRVAEESELAKWARLTGDAVEEALALTAMWMGGDPENAGSVTMNADFDDEDFSPQLFDSWLKAVGEGRLSVETMWARLVRAGELTEEFDPEEEKTRLEESGVAELEAMAEANRKLREQQQQVEQEGVEGEEDGEEIPPEEGVEG